jgi:putative PIN family toxin of toxin-antitoxin system
VIRAVVDPSVLVSAFIGRRDASPGRLVDAWIDARFTMIVSPLLLDELAKVLARPKFGRWSADGRDAAYLAGFAARGEHHADPVDPTARLRDPTDEYLVALALAAAADALVSLDGDMLEASIEGLPMLNPGAFLDRLSSTAQ